MVTVYNVTRKRLVRDDPLLMYPNIKVIETDSENISVRHQWRPFFLHHTFENSQKRTKLNDNVFGKTFDWFIRSFIHSKIYI